MPTAFYVKQQGKVSEQGLLSPARGPEHLLSVKQARGTPERFQTLAGVAVVVGIQLKAHVLEAHFLECNQARCATYVGI